MRDWIIVVLLATSVGALGALIVRLPWPTCERDGAQVLRIVVGEALLLGGCR
jgi:hypothetical protein